MSKPETEAADAATLRVECPNCGNADPRRMIVFSHQWVSLATGEQGDIEPTPPDPLDEVQCEGTVPRGIPCEYRGMLHEFLAAARLTAEAQAAPAPAAPKAAQATAPKVVKTPKVVTAAKQPALAIARVVDDDEPDELSYELDEASFDDEDA